MDARDSLSQLLDAARTADEFEYCCSLLRLRGAEDPGLDALQETYALAQQLVGLIHASLQDRLALRLLLFLYCHITEATDIYAIPANMARIVSGQRYSLNPFTGEMHATGQEARSPASRAERTAELCRSAGQEAAAELYDTIVHRPVRNAFFHSDYILTAETFNIRHGEGVVIERWPVHRVPLQWLMPKLEAGVNTALALLDLTLERIRSYKANKVLPGYLHGKAAPPVEVELLVDDRFGLIGFQSPPKGATPQPAAP